MNNERSENAKLVNAHLAIALYLIKKAKEIVQSELSNGTLPYHLRSGYLVLTRPSVDEESLNELVQYLKPIIEAEIKHPVDLFDNQV